MVKKLAWLWLQKNVMMDGDTMIYKRIGETLGPEVDSTYWKDKIQVDFIVFIDYKITCLKVGEIHILNGTDNLGT